MVLAPLEQALDENFFLLAFDPVYQSKHHALLFYFVNVDIPPPTIYFSIVKSITRIIDPYICPPAQFPHIHSLISLNGSMRQLSCSEIEETYLHIDSCIALILLRSESDLHLFF